MEREQVCVQGEQVALIPHIYVHTTYYILLAARAVAP